LKAEATYNTTPSTVPPVDPVEFTLKLTDPRQVAVIYALVNENKLYRNSSPSSFRDAKDAVYDALRDAGVRDSNTHSLESFKEILRKAGSR